MTDPASTPVTPSHVARLGDRSLFPELEAQAYLNHAAVAPPSLAVRDAVHRLLAEYGRTGLTAAIAAGALREQLRAELAALIECQPADLGLVQSTTTGLID